MVQDYPLWDFHVRTSAQEAANYHGRFEYACIEQMELCVEILKKIVEKYAVKEI